MISQRHEVANNKYLENYNSSDPSNCIIYLHADNLYGWAMSQPLPYGGFQWIEPTDDTINGILKAPEDSSYGYILEVDLKYIKEIHDLHNCYPVAPEKIKIKSEELMQQLLNNSQNIYIELGCNIFFWKNENI